MNDFLHRPYDHLGARRELSDRARYGNPYEGYRARSSTGDKAVAVALGVAIFMLALLSSCSMLPGA